MLPNLLILLSAAMAQTGDELPPPGSIAGIVINSSQEDRPVGDAQVVLRVHLDGQFVIAAETVTDAQGRFVFDNVPADPDYVYLPGANWQAVHYPAKRIRLDSRSPNVTTRIEVRDTIASLNPLVVRDHRIVIEPDDGALQVTESLLIDNPTSATYVGEPRGESNRAATLTLSIPSDFTRATFHDEFFGRRFVIIDKALVTDIPWEPGTRHLKFTYLLPNSGNRRIWERPLDRHTSNVLVTVRRALAKEVSCNIAPVSTNQENAVAFAANQLPEGHVLRVELGRLPVSFAAFAPWIALVVATGMAGATVLYIRRNPQRPAREVKVSRRTKRAHRLRTTVKTR
jgi:hypothetical protein